MPGQTSLGRVSRGVGLPLGILSSRAGVDRVYTIKDSSLSLTVKDASLTLTVKDDA